MKKFHSVLIALVLSVWAFGVSAQVPSGPAVKEPTAPAVDKWAQHYYNRLEEFRKENAALPKGQKNIVFLGDSITEAFPLKTHFPDKPVLNRGIVADGIGFNQRGVLNRLNECVFDCSPSVVFLLIGVNDLPDEAKTPDECMKRYRKVVEQIQQKCPGTKLVLETALPTGMKYKKHEFVNPRIDEFNKKIAELAKEKSLQLIDLNALYKDADGLLPADITNDGLHIKKEVYSRWAEKAKPLMP